MTLIRREWATPLTIGAFLLMAATGALMFFHLETRLQKTLHEWLGWALLAAVALHALVHWRSFVRYFQPGVARLAPALIGLFALVLLASFFVPQPGPQGNASPPALALRAIGEAPLATVAPLFGHDAASARAALAEAGIALQRDDQSLQSVIGSDRERLGQALRALSRQRAPVTGGP